MCWYGAGVPDSASVQEVIFWQGRTIQMMYHIIGQAMQRAGVQNQHPKDYLSFFCLGQFSSLPSPSVPSSSSLIHSIVYSFHSFTLSSYHHFLVHSVVCLCHSVIHSLSHSVSHSASQVQIPAVEKQVQHPLCCDPCELPTPTPPWHRHTPGTCFHPSWPGRPCAWVVKHLGAASALIQSR